MSSIPSKISLFQYSILAFPLAFAGLPLYIHAPDFYTRELGLGIGLIGIILLAIRLFDAIQDPFIGYISDKYAKQRLGIISSGVVMLFLGMFAVFYGPQLEIPVSLWFALSMILATTGFSIVTINLNTIGGFWHDEPGQRTRISAWREAFALIGLLIASILPAILQSLQSAEESFRILSWVFGVIIIAGFIMFTRFMKQYSLSDRVMKVDTQKGLSFLPILKGPDRHFFGVCFLTHLAASIPGVMVLFFIRDYLGANNLSGLFLCLYFIAGAALMSVWVRLANKIGKERAWLTSMLLAVVTFMWAYFLQPGDVVAYGIICILSGMALGADLALPPSMLADRITKQKKEAEATQYYALISFIPKIAIAIASGISFLILDHLGFTAGAENSSKVMQGLIILYAFVPCLIKLVAAFSLWRMHKREGDIYA
jgi:Na+/melibiose symporter-like transporter